METGRFRSVIGKTPVLLKAFQRTPVRLRVSAQVTTGKTTVVRMSERALQNGEALPPLKANTLRLYSMRFCPFAQRTRMVLAHKGIEHEVINVNLRHKPDWLLERNPLGLVPVLEYNDAIVYESSACDDYLDEVYQHNKLTAGDPYPRAQQKMLMELFGGVISAMSMQYRGRHTEEKKERAKVTMGKLLDIFEGKLAGKYFGGDKLSMLDIHIWPWFERMGVMGQMGGVEILPAGRFPKLNKWRDEMWLTKEVQATKMAPEHHLEFFMSFAQRAPQYDIGLPEAARL